MFHYISSEDTFDSTRLLRYRRGSVIRVNFGFNVGKELGGMHFAVVIDNDNKRNADVLTVIPLSSTDGRTVHERNVDLGTELFTKILDAHNKLYSDAKEHLSTINENINAFTSAIELFKRMQEKDANSPDIKKQIEEILNYQTQLQMEQKLLEKQVAKLEHDEAEIHKMKSGSMAVVNQITTVSKQRIFTPKRSEDFLFGITLSPAAMDKINEKIKELYVHN